MNRGDTIEVQTGKYRLSLILQLIYLHSLLKPLLLDIELPDLDQLRILSVSLLHQAVLILLQLSDILLQPRQQLDSRRQQPLIIFDQHRIFHEAFNELLILKFLGLVK